MSGARHQNLLAQARHSFFQAVEGLPIHRDYPVEFACYEERGLANLGSAEKWRQFPNPVYVPIPVESALAGDHPLMGPLLAQREAELAEDLAKLPPGGREPRTVLFFTGAPVHGSRGIDAQFAATVLMPFLEIVKSEYSAEKHGRIGERGPRKDEDEARLLLIGLPRGSFGLELSQPESDDLFAGEQLSDVLVRLTELLSSAGKSDEEFVHAMEAVSPRVYTRLPDFFRI